MAVLTRRTDSDPELFGLFEASGHNVRRGAELLRDLLADFPEQSELARDILVCEQEGDRLAHDILHLVAAQEGRCPLGAADAHALTTAIDDIVDFTEEAADRLVLYGVEAPMEQAQAMTVVLVDACGQVAAALCRLSTGADMVVELVEIHRLENEGDRLMRAATASLFVQGIDPMIVIRWKDIFDSLEHAVDACETVAHVLEGIGLKRRRR